MKKLYILSLFFLLLQYASAQNIKHKITIRLFSNSIDSSEHVYITGNQNELGNWQPDKVELQKYYGYWQKIFEFPSNVTIQFKFTKGSWLSEALDENNLVPENFSLTVKNDTSLTFTINNWKDTKPISPVAGQVTGKVIYHNNMKFEGLLPRDVSVWLPPGYSVKKNKRYPVLYMHDGQNLFDPTTSFTGIDWQIDETADSLIRNRIIDPIIIVGINNTRDRTEEYSPTDKGIKYMQFIINKLKPFIDSTYRTLPDRNNTAVGGSSLGGLISFMLAWNYSNYFSKAACFSPAFKYDNIDYSKFINEYHGIKKDVVFFFNNGGKGLEQVLLPGVNLMKNVLLEKGFTLYQDLFVNIDLEAEHNENGWAKSVHIPLKLFFEPGKMEYSNSKILNRGIRKRNLLSKRYRFQLSTTTKFDDDDFVINLPHVLNFNFRNSQLDSIDYHSNPSFSFSTEVGINVFPNPTFFLPYAKIGPELRFFKRIYFDVHAGLTLVIAAEQIEHSIIPIPFVGTEIGYVHSLSQKHSLELELGVNGLSSFYLYYIGMSFTF